MSHTDNDDPGLERVMGRPEDSEKLKAFLHVTKCIENKNLAFLPETVHLLAVEQVVH